MLHINNLYSPTQLQQKITKPLNFIHFALAILIFSTLSCNLKAIAQPVSINKKEINNYAQAVLAMEPARQQAFEKIKKIIGSKDVPQIICHDPKSFNPLPKNAKEIAVNYCKQSKEIVEKSGLTVEKFNTITVEIQTNNKLKDQLYDALLLLQKNSKTQ